MKALPEFTWKNFGRQLGWSAIGTVSSLLISGALFFILSKAEESYLEEQEARARCMLNHPSTRAKLFEEENDEAIGLTK